MSGRWLSDGAISQSVMLSSWNWRRTRPGDLQGSSNWSRAAPRCNYKRKCHTGRFSGDLLCLQLNFRYLHFSTDASFPSAFVHCPVCERSFPLVNGWQIEWMNEWKNERTNERINERKNERMNESIKFYWPISITTNIYIISDYI